MDSHVSVQRSEEAGHQVSCPLTLYLDSLESGSLTEPGARMGPASSWGYRCPVPCALTQQASRRARTGIRAIMFVQQTLLLTEPSLQPQH